MNQNENGLKIREAVLEKKQVKMRYLPNIKIKNIEVFIIVSIYQNHATLLLSEYCEDDKKGV